MVDGLPKVEDLFGARKGVFMGKNSVTGAKEEGRLRQNNTSQWD
jgi:hypothetical protein